VELDEVIEDIPSNRVSDSSSLACVNIGSI